jgi:hypothetical protein
MHFLRRCNVNIAISAQYKKPKASSTPEESMDSGDPSGVDGEAVIYLPKAALCESGYSNITALYHDTIKNVNNQDKESLDDEREGKGRKGKAEHNTQQLNIIEKKITTIFYYIH